MSFAPKSSKVGKGIGDTVRGRNPRRFAVALVGLVTLAACGSTVSTQGVGAGGSLGQNLSGSGALSGASAAGTNALSSSSDGQTGATTTAPTQGSTSSTGGSIGSSQGGSGGGLPSNVPTSGFGFDAKSIYIGVTTNKDAQTTLAAVGITSGSLGDQTAMTKAVLADINASGGVLGRKIIPVFHDVKTADTSTNPQGAAQSACVAFTEDVRVAAALELVLDSRAFAQCMVKHRAFVVSNGLTFTDKSYVQGLSPYFFRLVSPLAERLVSTLLGRLTALNYFDHWNTATGGPDKTGKAPVKVGLFYVDEPATTRVFGDMATRLQHMGFAVNKYAYARQDSTYENAVLQFKAAGVTHLIGDNASYVLLMRQTQAQGYYPRYGLTSYNGSGILLQQTAPASAMAGALGIGWVPTIDVDAAHDPGSTGTAYSSCLQTMKKHTVDVSTRSALANALGICDGLRVLVQSMQSGGGFDGPHITSGRGSFSFESAATFSNNNNAGRIDLPSAVRDLAFDSSCKCFLYLSKTNRSLD